MFYRMENEKEKMTVVNIPHSLAERIKALKPKVRAKMGLFSKAPMALVISKAIEELESELGK